MQSELSSAVLRRANAFLSNLQLDSLTILELGALLYFEKDNTDIANHLLARLADNWQEIHYFSVTIVVYAALARHNPTVITGTQLAFIVRRLTAMEKATGGPYRNEQGKVDLLLNILIAELLTPFTKVPLPLRQYLIRQRFAGNALLRYAVLGTTDSDIVRHAQLPTGAWPPSKHFPHITPSPVVATAFIASSLLPKPIMQSTTSQHTAFYSQAMRAIANDLQTMPKPLRIQMAQVVAKVQAADKNQEIMLLPLLFHRSLVHPQARETELLALCIANFYCWIAYIIYDDFLDGEGKPALLPIASIALRHSLHWYGCFNRADQNISKQVHIAFTLVDVANSWEVRQARYTVKDNVAIITSLPSYKSRRQLAHRSFAHILGPQLLVAQHSQATPQNTKLITNGLIEYLIARQLNDDLHDWQEDFLKGRLSFVVTLLLQALQIQPGRYNISELLGKMQRLFWEEILDSTCRLLRAHAKKAKTNLQKSLLLQDGAEIYSLIDALDTSARQSLSKHQRQKDFLAAYKQDKMAQ